MKQRTLLTLSITVFWLVMMGLLVKREVLVARYDPLRANMARLEEPNESWLALRAADGARVGYVHVQNIPEERRDLQGITSQVAVHMTLTLFGRSTNLDLGGHVWRPYATAVAEFAFQVQSGEHDFRIDGEVADQRLRGTVYTADEELPLDLPIDAQLAFSSGLGSALTLPDIDVGETVRISSFDPLSMSSTPTRVQCVASEVLEIAGENLRTRVLVLESSGMQTRAWIDDNADVVRAETPLGLVLERTTQAEALAPVSGSNASSFLELTAIRPRGKRPFRGARAMTFELEGLGKGDANGPPTDATQVKLAPGRYRIAAAAEGPAAGGAEGTGGEEAAPGPETLAADAFVQSDHPRIRAQAETILADVGPDPRARALALHEWVYGALDKIAVISIPSALEVLETRRGDCNEHAVLYTALARAAGLPTRIAIGIVWSEDLNGFYYHAWPEVWIEGRWHWMDPTLDQARADATHIKLLNGGIETWSQLLPYLGRLEINVLEIE